MFALSRSCWYLLATWGIQTLSGHAKGQQAEWRILTHDHCPLAGRHHCLCLRHVHCLRHLKLAHELEQMYFGSEPAPALGNDLEDLQVFSIFNFMVLTCWLLIKLCRIDFQADWLVLRALSGSGFGLCSHIPLALT